MKNNNQKDKRRGGFYWVEGKPYVSVTNVLGSVLRKPGLEYWKMREVYQAMVKNPSLSEQEALAAPYAKSDKAKSRGTTIHSLIEFYKGSGEIIKTTPEFQPFVNAFKKWVEEHKITIVEQEKTIVNKKDKYAGTLDLLVKINGNSLPTVIDIKTSKANGQTYPDYSLQVSAYIHALYENGVKTNGCGIVVLRENGSFLYEAIVDCYDEFLAVKKIYEWQNKELFKEYES